MSDILMLAGLIVVLFIALALTYVQWRKATPEARMVMVEEAVRRLVDAAEQVFPQPKQGQAKYAWVMGRLQKRFPNVEWETLSEYVEQAVHHLNAIKARRNG